MRRPLLLLAVALSGGSPVAAQLTPPRAPVVAATPRTILFIGNSFTEGANTPVRSYRVGSVTNLNGDPIGGVPALFKTFAEEAGLAYAVSLETYGGKTLAFHYAEQRRRFDRPWDAVVLQEYSTLDPDRPGDPANYLAAVRSLSRFFAARNPAVAIYLTATWTRADQTYRPGGHWYGQPVTRMALDLRRAADRARDAVPHVTGVLPVGEAWNRAFASGVADPDPYDGIAFGQLDLWSYDQYHASTAGYYLEALIAFGRVTGLDPRSLGRGERAADELGLSPDQAAALQRVAAEELGRSR